MSRFIDADAVLELIQEEFHKTDPNGEEQIGILTCHRIVRTAPTADVVEVRHGYWLSAYEYALKIGATDERLIENAKNEKWWKFCCHCEQPVKWDYNYCPTCGAKMDCERGEQ